MTRFVLTYMSKSVQGVRSARRLESPILHPYKDDVERIRSTYKELANGLRVAGHEDVVLIEETIQVTYAERL